MCVFFFVIDWRKGNLSVWPIGDADLGKTHYLLLWCLQPLNRECVCGFFFFLKGMEVGMGRDILSLRMDPNPSQKG